MPPGTLDVASYLAVVPPPPAGPISLGVIADPDLDPDRIAETLQAASPETAARRNRRPRGRAFSTPLDLSELDERNRPGVVWQGRSRSISGSNLVFHSRRMSYVNRQLIVLVHLIDDEPVPLLVRVHNCDYDGEGLYRIDADLLPIPDDGAVVRGIAVLREQRRRS